MPCIILVSLLVNASSFRLSLYSHVGQKVSISQDKVMDLFRSLLFARGDTDLECTEIDSRWTAISCPKRSPHIRVLQWLLDSVVLTNISLVGLDLVLVIHFDS